MPDYNAELREAGRTLSNLGLVRATAGNLSARVSEDRILITTTGSRLENLTDGDLVVIDFEDHVLVGAGQPSTEYKAHLEIYKRRQDVVSIAHTHSAYATTLACLKKTIKPVNPEAEDILGVVGLCPDIPHGTPELAEGVAEALGNGRAVLIERHGVIAAGGSVQEAVDIAALVEETAKITYLIDLHGDKGWILLDGKTAQSS